MKNLKRLLKITTLLLLLILAISYVNAHKSAASTSQSTESYVIEFGKIPGHPYVNNEQQIFFKVENKNTKIPASNLRAEFEIYIQDASQITPETVMDTSSAQLLRKFSAVQEIPGMYIGRHTFDTRGSYLVNAKLYDSENLVSEITEHMHVEPNGPSIFFWLYMVIALIIGAFIASRSHKF